MIFRIRRWWWRSGLYWHAWRAVQAELLALREDRPSMRPRERWLLLVAAAYHWDAAARCEGLGDAQRRALQAAAKSGRIAGRKIGGLNE